MRSALFSLAICVMSTGAVHSQESLRKLEFGVQESDASGNTDVASVLQKAVGDGGVELVLPCGRFLIGSAVELPSRTTLLGKGRCTVFLMAHDAAPTRLQRTSMPGASGAQRSIFTNRAPGDAGITIRSISIDGSQTPANGQMISFYRASKIVIDDVSFLGSGTPRTQDGVSFVSSSEFVIKNSYCDNFSNACYDVWGGSKDFEIYGNVANGRDVLNYGILVNGLTTDNQPATSSNGSIYRNRINGTKGLGIGIYGLCSPDRNACGTVSNVSVEDNQIDGVSKYHGIMTGNSSDIIISHNQIRGVAGDGVKVSAQNKGGQTTNVVVEKNQITGTAGSATGVSVGTGLDRPANIRVLQDNSITGYAQPMRIAPLPKHLE